MNMILKNNNNGLKRIFPYVAASLIFLFYLFLDNLNVHAMNTSYGHLQVVRTDSGKYKSLQGLAVDEASAKCVALNLSMESGSEKGLAYISDKPMNYASHGAFGTRNEYPDESEFIQYFSDNFPLQFYPAGSFVYDGKTYYYTFSIYTSDMFKTVEMPELDIISVAYTSGEYDVIETVLAKYYGGSGDIDVDPVKPDFNEKDAVLDKNLGYIKNLKTVRDFDYKGTITGTNTVWSDYKLDMTWEGGSYGSDVYVQVDTINYYRYLFDQFTKRYTYYGADDKLLALGGALSVTSLDPVKKQAEEENFKYAQGKVNYWKLRLLKYDLALGKWVYGPWSTIKWNGDISGTITVENNLIDEVVDGEYTGNLIPGPGGSSETVFDRDGNETVGGGGMDDIINGLPSGEAGVAELLKSFIDIVKSFMTGLGEFPALVGQVFSFLPSQIVGFLVIGIIVSILLRILSR